MAAEDLAIPDEAVHAVLKNLQSDKSKEVINAIEWLVANRPKSVSSERLYRYVTELVGHSNERIRVKALDIADQLNVKLKPAQLRMMILHDAEAIVREKAAFVLSKESESVAVEFLYHDDLVVIKGALLGLLTTHPEQAQGQMALKAMLQSEQVKSQLAALDIVKELSLSTHSKLIGNALKHPDSSVVMAAIETAGRLKAPALTEQVAGLLKEKIYWRQAARSLAQLEAIPVLSALEISANSLTLTQRVIVTAGQMRSEEAHTLLVEMVQRPDVTIRTSALQALKNYPNAGGKAAVFEQLLKEEFLLAQRFLNATNESDLSPDLKSSLNYEQEVLIQRIFGLLMQQYDQESILSTQASLLHSSRERRANSLELLQNVVPRHVYAILHALLDNVADADEIRLMDAQLGALTATGTIKDYILQKGTRHFTDWTIRLALRGIPLETLFQYPDLRVMSHSSATATVSITERVMVLKNKELFAETPENVLNRSNNF